MLTPCNSFKNSPLSHIFRPIYRLKHQDEANCCRLHFSAASVFVVGGRLCALALVKEKVDKAGKIIQKSGSMSMSKL